MKPAVSYLCELPSMTSIFSTTCPHDLIMMSFALNADARSMNQPNASLLFVYFVVPALCAFGGRRESFAGEARRRKAVDHQREQD